MRRVICAILVVMFAALSACAVFGHDFAASTATALASALGQAQGNGEDDVITLAPGVYQGHFSYKVRDGKSLVIRGAARTTPEEVIIDGEGNGVVFVIAGRSDGAEVTLSGLTVQSGNAKGNVEGGGIRIETLEGSLSLHLQHVIVQRNTTSYFGGGIGMMTSENSALYLEIRDCIIRHNDAPGNDAGLYGRGGGIYVNAYGGNSSVDILIVDSLIHGNRANWTGGGIELAASEVGENNTVRATIVNTTITGNTSNMHDRDYAPGGGIRAYGYQGEGAQVVLDIYNSIVWGNATLGGMSGQDIAVKCRNPGEAEVHDYHSDIGDLFVDDSRGAPIYGSEAVISADPLFVNAEAEDFHLVAGSPCIDVGTVDLPLELPDLDLDGIPRVCGPAPDLGAYEQCSE